LLSKGESGPPCGVPSTLGLTRPFSIFGHSFREAVQLTLRNDRNAIFDGSDVARNIKFPGCEGKEKCFSRNA